MSREIKARKRLSRRQRAGYSYPAHADSLCHENGPATKGARTKCRLKAAAARALEASGFRALKMTEICLEAGLSQGAIYQYFENKRDITFAVLKDFIAWIGVQLQDVPIEDDPYRRIYNSNLQYTRIVAANPGLIRCVRQLADELHEFNQLWQETNAAWYALVATSLKKQMGDTATDNRQWFYLAHALGSLVDEYLHETYIRRNPRLAGLARSPRKLAELLSILSYRMAYGAEPDPAHFPQGHSLIQNRQPAAMTDAL